MVHLLPIVTLYQVKILFEIYKNYEFNPFMPELKMFKNVFSYYIALNMGYKGCESNKNDIISQSYYQTCTGHFKIQFKCWKLCLKCGFVGKKENILCNHMVNTGVNGLSKILFCFVHGQKGMVAKLKIDGRQMTQA